MRLIAIIGPFTAPTLEGIVTNIAHAKLVRDAVLRLGASPYCSHTMVGDLWGVISEDLIVPALMEGTTRCDGGVLVSGWERSPGSLREIAAFEHLGKPVFRTVEDLKRFIDEE